MIELYRPKFLKRPWERVNSPEAGLLLRMLGEAVVALNEGDQDHFNECMQYWESRKDLDIDEPISRFCEAIVENFWP